MIVKIHKNELGQILVAVCDSDLVGKVFEQDDLQLDLSSGFFKGEEKNAIELKEILKKAYIVNITGKNSIAFALEHNLISEKNVIKIANIPHAECVIAKD